MDYTQNTNKLEWSYNALYTEHQQTGMELQCTLNRTPTNWNGATMDYTQNTNKLEWCYNALYTEHQQTGMELQCTIHRTPTHWNGVTMDYTQNTNKLEWCYNGITIIGIYAHNTICRWKMWRTTLMSIWLPISTKMEISAFFGWTSTKTKFSIFNGLHSLNRKCKCST